LELADDFLIDLTIFRVVVATALSSPCFNLGHSVFFDFFIIELTDFFEQILLALE